jgi:Rieske Fe-S protein
MEKDRRKFCQAAGLVVVGAALPACGTASNNGSSGDMGPLACGTGSGLVSIGIDINSVPMDSAVLFQNAQFDLYICRDDKGVYALDAACTHLGCDVKPTAYTPSGMENTPAIGMTVQGLSQGFDCRCHGATYDPNGEKPTTPAPSPLTHYLVCMTTSGIIVVDTDQPVDPATRYRL